MLDGRRLRDILNISMATPDLLQGLHRYNEDISFYAFQGIYSRQRRKVYISHVSEFCFNKRGSEWFPGSNAWRISFPREGK